MVFKLVMAFAKSWGRLMSESQLPEAIAGLEFLDRTEIIQMPSHNDRLIGPIT